MSESDSPRRVPRGWRSPSQRCPADVVLKSYDWAREQRTKGVTVICGNHSQIEKDVFDILLKGDQPIILALARGLMKNWRTDVLLAIKSQRLLVIAPFNKEITKVTRKNAEIRNRLIITTADELVIGYKTSGGQLDHLLDGHSFNNL